MATQEATFIFGGRNSDKTYEYLPKDSTEWLMGKTEIPGRGFSSGCAIAVKSGKEIWLIGGYGTGMRILCFDVVSHTFQVMPFQLNVGRLNVGRQFQTCAFIPNTNKIMITGGCNVDSTEILDAKDGSVTMASPMNSKRRSHGIGIITVNGEDQVAVFGGHDGENELDSAELYNTQMEKWEMSDLKLSEPKLGIGFLTIKVEDIFSQL